MKHILYIYYQNLVRNGPDKFLLNAKVFTGRGQDWTFIATVLKKIGEWLKYVNMVHTDVKTAAHTHTHRHTHTHTYTYIYIYINIYLSSCPLEEPTVYINFIKYD